MARQRKQCKLMWIMSYTINPFIFFFSSSLLRQEMFKKTGSMCTFGCACCELKNNRRINMPMTEEALEICVPKSDIQVRGEDLEI